jgi:hypothetical protein
MKNNKNDEKKLIDNLNNIVIYSTIYKNSVLDKETSNKVKEIINKNKWGLA